MPDLVNHVCFVVDRSASIRMYGLEAAVVAVVDAQVAHLAALSTTRDQETRVSVVLFDDAPEWVVWDKDVLRMPSLRGLYQAGGQTALIDATVEAVDELGTVPTRHGDHAFLLYVVTDGEENRSRRYVPDDLKHRAKRLAADWTFACLVPSEQGRVTAEGFGFPPGNTVVWETTQAGLTTAGEVVSAATERYFAGRAKGIRSTSTLFKPDVGQLTQAAVNRTLRRLNPGDYQLIDVTQGPHEIAPLVEVRTGRPYSRGSAHYRLAKKETVQAGKEVVLVHKRTAVAYAGPEARALLGLPDHDLRVAPADHPDYDIYVQSTSVNRRLVDGDRVLVRLP